MKLGLQESAEGPFPGMEFPKHEQPSAAGRRGTSTGVFPAKPLSPGPLPRCSKWEGMEEQGREGNDFSWGDAMDGFQRQPQHGGKGG